MSGTGNMASVQGGPPRVEAGSYAKGDLRTFLQEYHRCEREFRFTGDETRNPTPMKYLVPEPYLRVMCKTVFQGGRKLEDVLDEDVKAALRQGAGITMELPDGLRFIEKVTAATRTKASESVNERVINVEIGLIKCLLDNEWMESECSA